MELTEEEKEVFKLYDENLTLLPSSHVEKGLLEFYNFDGYHPLEVTTNYVKKILLKISKEENINIDENESFDNEELLSELVKVYEGTFAGFDHSNYNDFQKFKLYFDSLIENKSSDYIEHIIKSFETAHSGIRGYFSDNLYDILSFVSEFNDDLLPVNNNSNEQNFSLPQRQVETSETIENIDFNNSEEDDFSFPQFGEWGWVNDGTYDGIKKEDLPEVQNERVIITEDKMKNYMKFVNSVLYLHKCHILGIKIVNYLSELFNQKKLDEFYSNSGFIKDYDQIMSHDENKNVYYFHGTQTLEDAKSILDQGLGMTQNILSSTAYREFTKDELILYSRGFEDKTGKDAIVILDAPIVDGREKSIVEKNDFQTEITFNPSGLHGLTGKPNYIVRPENIVGYVDKLNKKVVFNPKYRNYKGINNSLADDMVEKMVSGEIDTNGQPIIPEDVNTDIKSKGFAKLGVLGLVTILISIAIIILGIILIK